MQNKVDIDSLIKAEEDPIPHLITKQDNLGPWIQSNHCPFLSKTNHILWEYLTDL